MSFEKNILESQVFFTHLDRIIIRVGSVWAAEVGVAVCCQRFSHSNTHTHTHIRRRVHITYYKDFWLSNIFISACSGWLKIFSVKNVEKIQKQKQRGEKHSQTKTACCPPVFHNFSFLFIYTIRYIFVFMCCSPTDLRFAS